MKTYAERSEAKNLKFKKINILFILIITVKYFPVSKFFPVLQKIFSLCQSKIPCVSLSGKSKNQIPCFPCAMATLYLKYFNDRSMYESENVRNEKEVHETLNSDLILVMHE